MADKEIKESAKSKADTKSNKVNSRVYAQYQNIQRDINSTSYITDPAFKEAADEKLKRLTEGANIDPSKPVTEEVDLEMIAHNTGELKDLQEKEGKKAAGKAGEADVKVGNNKVEESKFKAVGKEDEKKIGSKKSFQAEY